MSEGAFIDTGAPEYFISHFIRSEAVPGDLVRLYFGKMRRDQLMLEYTVLVPLECLAVMTRQCLALCAEDHNEKAWKVMEARH